MSHIKQPEGLGYLGLLVMFSKPLPMIRIYVTGDAWWSSPSILFARSTMKQLLYCFLINGFVTCVASQDLQTVSIADSAYLVTAMSLQAMVVEPHGTTSVGALRSI
jgi:hypothetical protein